MVNAKIAEIDDETGSVDIGKSADFMVVKNNPLENANALKNATHVFFRGNEVDISGLKKIDKIEGALPSL